MFVHVERTTFDAVVVTVILRKRSAHQHEVFTVRFKSIAAFCVTSITSSDLLVRGVPAGIPA